MSSLFVQWGSDMARSIWRTTQNPASPKTDACLIKILNMSPRLCRLLSLLDHYLLRPKFGGQNALSCSCLV